MKLPRQPRAVVFDLDGTLIDSEALVREGYFAAAPAFGIEITDEQFRSCVGLSRDRNDAQLRGFFGETFPLADFYEGVRAHIGDRNAPLKAGAAELLDALDALELPYALATSSGRPWVERHFSAYGLHPRFRAIISRDDVANTKPHPEPYLKATAALRNAPDFTLAIEDSVAGVTSAHAAGLMTIMIPDLLDADDDCRAKALHIAETLHDIAPLLR